VVPRLPKTLALDPRTYDAYVGRYQAELPDGQGMQEIIVTKERDRLMVQPKGKSKVEVIPESPDEFYVQAVDGLVEFLKGPTGAVTEMRLLQDNQRIRARRVAAGTPLEPIVEARSKAGIDSRKPAKPREAATPATKP
jgi:Domain of unknown function (DUF3471)